MEQGKYIGLELPNGTKVLVRLDDKGDVFDVECKLNDTQDWNSQGIKVSEGSLDERVFDDNDNIIKK